MVPADRESDLSDAISDAYLEQEVFQTIPEPDLPMVKLLLNLAGGEESAISYLRGSGPAPAETGLSGRVNSDFDAAKTLGGLFRVLTLSINGQPPVCLATYLFLDEVESILDDRQTDLLIFFQGIRNLINELPYNFCLLLSFSADAALVEAVLPRGILERMTRPGYVELPSLMPEHARDFIRGLFDQHRPEGFNQDNSYHPFSEESIELALERVPQITPRQLFRILNSILIRAIQREGLQGGEEISAEMADSILLAGGVSLDAGLRLIGPALRPAKDDVAGNLDVISTSMGGGFEMYRGRNLRRQRVPMRVSYYFGPKLAGRLTIPSTSRKWHRLPSS